MIVASTLGHLSRLAKHVLSLQPILGAQRKVKLAARRSFKMRFEPLEQRTLLSVNSPTQDTAETFIIPVEYPPVISQQVFDESKLTSGGLPPVGIFATVAEVEPNNSTSAAQAVTMATGDILATAASDWLNVNGDFSSLADVDVYQFTIGARSGFFAEIDSSSPTLDTAFTLYNSSGTQLATNSSGYDLDGFSPPLGLSGDPRSLDPSLYMDLTPGTYYIQVNVSASPAPYVLRMLADTNFAATPPVLNSFAAATDTLYLDFDGHAATDTWGTYTALPFDFSGTGAEFSPGERLTIFNTWRMISEDFSPFNINITTVDPGSFNNGQAFRQVITMSSPTIVGQPSGILGVAFVSSYSNSAVNTAFTWAGNFFAFAGSNGGTAGWFTATALEMGNTSSHEFGHALGLSHYSTDGGIATASTIPNGILSTPDYGLNREIWTQGDPEGSGTAQDDDSVISNGTNAIGYRTDDHGNTSQSATVMVGTSAAGIIENVDTGDSDFFLFTAFGSTTITADVDPYTADLVPVLELYDGTGALLTTHAPGTPVDATITQTLVSGTYYARVRSNGGQGEMGQYTLRVSGQLPPATLQFALMNQTVSEGAGTGTLLLTLSSSVSLNVTVPYTLSGTATSGSDYSLALSPLTILAGQTSAAITVNLVSDTLDEVNETVIVTLGTLINANPGFNTVHTLTIQDDDPSPSVVLAMVGSPVVENGGVATVRATLSAPSSQTVTIDLALTGTASSGVDYSSSATSIVIAPGATSGSITLTSINDLTSEGNETIIVDVSNVANGVESGVQQVTAIITDDEPTVTTNLSIIGSSVAESGGFATVRASINVVAAQTVTINLAFGGTAINTSDYSRSNTQIIITPGNTSGSITLTSLDDTTFEGNETIVVDIASVTGGTENGSQQVVATIVDNDSQPSVSLSVAGLPFNEASGLVTVRATLSNPSSQTVTVNLGFTGTATNTTDYSRSGTQITIPAGTLTGAVTLVSVSDNQFEGNETIVIDVTSVTNGTEFGTQQATVTLVDDDAAPSVTLSRFGNPLNENGGVATVVATITNPSTQPVVIDLGFTGSATNLVDYSRSSAQITIPAGSLSGAITLTSLDDSLDEMDETVIVSVDAVTGGTENGVQQVTTTIIDDDGAPSVFLQGFGSPFSEPGGSAVVRATLSNLSASPVVVEIAFSGTATLGDDYSASAMSISIPAGSLSGGITLTALDDIFNEGSETVIAAITNVSGGTESGTQQATLTLADDGVDPFTLNGTSLEVVSTAGDDTLTILFTTATHFSLQVGSLAFNSSTATITEIMFDGGDGNDTLAILTGPGADEVGLSVDGATMTGAGYSFTAVDVEFKFFFGDANDSAMFGDSQGNDLLYQLPSYALMLDSAATYYNQTIGFGANAAIATGGNDLLFVYGTAGDDEYMSSITQSSMTSTNLELIGTNFNQVYAFGLGGTDTAVFNGSDGNELFYALDGYGVSVVTSGSFLQYVVGFSEVVASGGGGLDVALFYDSPGNDSFVANPTTARMTGPGYLDQADGFDQVFAIASGGGNDTAALDGSNQDDLFSGNEFDAALFRPGVYLLQVYAFDTVDVALSGNGFDIAELIDGFGDDVLNASGSTAELTYAAGNKIKLSAFDLVYAKNKNGGVNTKNVAPSLTYQLEFDGTW